MFDYSTALCDFLILGALEKKIVRPTYLLTYLLTYYIWVKLTINHKQHASEIRGKSESQSVNVCYHCVFYIHRYSRLLIDH